MNRETELSLLETLDHLLDRGVVITGEAVISIGSVDLLYLGLNIILTNVDALIDRGAVPVLPPLDERKR